MQEIGFFTDYSLMHGENEIEFASLEFVVEIFDQFMSVLLARVTRKVEEFKIEFVEIKSAGMSSTANISKSCSQQFRRKVL